MSAVEHNPPGGLTDDQLTTIVRRVVREAGLLAPYDLSTVLRLAAREVAGRADGRRVVEAVETYVRGIRKGVY